MIKIRPETPNDYAQIYEVNRLAFGRENEARLVEALRRRPEFIPALSLVAEEDGRIAGHVLFSPITLESEGGEKQAIALAPVAVLPEMQRRGIGSALIKYGLEACRRQGHRLVILVGHPEYYPRFGFKPARPMGIEAPFPVRNEAWMALELEPGATRDLHGLVRYPEPFNDV
jgi:putative acetyltransferase